MSRDVSGQSVTDLPDGIGDWIAELARDRDISEEELLSELLNASAGVPDADGVRDRFEGVQSELTALEQDIDELDTDLEEKVSDVRERVIQVKREVDGKADADHGHPDLASRVDDLAADVSALDDDIDALEEEVETSMAELSAETEALQGEVSDFSADIDRKLNVLGAAAVELRDRVQTLLTEREKRVVLEELQADANRSGVGTARCESCSNSVRVGLLTEPRCPHCNESFNEVDPKDGFFGSHVLRTGRPPALKGEVEATESDLDDIVEE
jgi:DNA repair exonuclease SbcCD ATPase subunit